MWLVGLDLTACPSSSLLHPPLHTSSEPPTRSRSYFQAVAVCGRPTDSKPTYLPYLAIKNTDFHQESPHPEAPTLHHIKEDFRQHPYHDSPNRHQY
ncbi:hypothetical protein N658DRAFT_70452 [Parathielavia hyrcaniae]|uniref:Uncharacterized protein n=1 Tax=Parathielavia hyrcaniae TaxID=113614 RepID=A0AAN6T245_9PEZI|nr:hypothetical protein N658DRAFT_70452 [Parathielavia hyrcaniae]